MQDYNTQPQNENLPQPFYGEESLEVYLPLIKRQLTVKQPVSTAPTWIPKNQWEAEWPYENGTTRRWYYYVNKTWRYTALT